MIPKQDQCPRPEEISRAVSEGADIALKAHFARCERCAAQWREEGSLLLFARQLPWQEPTLKEREEVRTSLIALAVASSLQQKPHRRRLIWPLAAAVVLLVGAAALLLRESKPSAPPPLRTPRAIVFQNEASRFMQLGEPGDEVIRLTDGSITVEVSHLAPGERFRVVTGDSEVEVRGTVFEVVASQDRLVSVRVLKGKVEVRREGVSRAILRPGERWEASAPDSLPASPNALPASQEVLPASIPASAPVVIAPAPPELSAPQPKETGNSLVRERTSAELAFEEGFSALRAGELSQAATSFKRAAEVDPMGPLAEDAWFWFTVSRARSSGGSEAQKVLRSFLMRYPNSPRAGEISVALGWLLLEEGNLTEATLLFQAASDDRVAEVRKSAREGLAAVEKRQKAGTEATSLSSTPPSAPE